MSQIKEEFVFIWIIKNISLWNKKGRYTEISSPTFLAKNFQDTQYTVLLYPKEEFVSLYLCSRRDYDAAEFAITFRIELCNTKEEVLAFAEKNAIQVKGRRQYLIPNLIRDDELMEKVKNSETNSLVIRCHLQKNALAGSPSFVTCRAQTEINVDVFSFLWKVYHHRSPSWSAATTFTTNEGRQFCINLKSPQDDFLIEIKQVAIELASSVRVKCEILLLSEKGTTTFSGLDFFTFEDGSSTWHFPSFFKKSSIQHRDTFRKPFLDLKFIFSISNGFLFEKYIEDETHQDFSLFPVVSRDTPATLSSTDDFRVLELVRGMWNCLQKFFQKPIMGNSPEKNL